MSLAKTCIITTCLNVAAVHSVDAARKGLQERSVVPGDVLRHLPPPSHPCNNAGTAYLVVQRAFGELEVLGHGAGRGLAEPVDIMRHA